jgi:hypothetical protein
VLEMRFGIQILPAGKRRSALLHAFETLLVDKIEQRIASFDLAAAEHAADLMAARHRKARSAPVISGTRFRPASCSPTTRRSPRGTPVTSKISSCPS